MKKFTVEVSILIFAYIDVEAEDENEAAEQITVDAGIREVMGGGLDIEPGRLSFNQDNIDWNRTSVSEAEK